MRRRDFITLVGGVTAAWPLVARAQTIPIIGFLAQGTQDEGAALLSAVRKGLGEANLIESKDFTSEFRWTQNDAVRLPGLAAELVQRRVAIIVVLDTQTAARAAKLFGTKRTSRTAPRTHVCPLPGRLRRSAIINEIAGGWPPSHLIGREALGCRQPAGRDGASPQPP